GVILEKNGKTIDLHEYVANAQLFVESMFDILLARQVVSHSSDYHFSDWQSWGFVRTKYPVQDCVSLSGYLGNTKQIEYPVEWLSSHECSVGLPYRQIHVVPNGGGVIEFNQNTIAINGSFANRFAGLSYIPNYWRVSYWTGWEKVPQDLLTLTQQYAAIAILSAVSGLVLPPGLSSQSLSIDGLSQSKSFTQSGQNTAYGGRIAELQKSIELALPYLNSKYKTISVLAL
ncbi:MAG: hypothetical protein ACRDBG_10630, partial [Waterburya sp.]